ncbi:hypothetical protein SRHO_G00174580 [Serrasalmus rhombeus]
MICILVLSAFKPLGEGVECEGGCCASRDPTASRVTTLHLAFASHCNSKCKARGRGRFACRGDAGGGLYGLELTLWGKRPSALQLRLCPDAVSLPALDSVTSMDSNSQHALPMDYSDSAEHVTLRRSGSPCF